MNPSPQPVNPSPQPVNPSPEPADPSLLGADHAGIWTRREARRVLTDGQITGLIRSYAWQTVWPGVFADGGYELSPTQRAFAAVLASGGEGQPVAFGPPDPKSGRRRRRLRAVACGRTAARFYGFPLIDDDDPATGAREILIDDIAGWVHGRTLRRRTPDGEVRELRRHELAMGKNDLVRTKSGLWLTSPVRTLVDCASLLTHESLVCALDDALHREVVSEGELLDAVKARSGRRGGLALSRAVGLADGRAEAPSETLARLLLLPVLPGLVPQVELFDDVARLVACFDLGDEALRLAVESDGRRAHAGDAMAAKDRHRDVRTERFGWTTERLTWFELRRQQEAARGRVVEVAGRLQGSARSRQPPTSRRHH